MARNTEVDFWNRVEKTSECWVWTGKSYNFSYQGKKYLPHRISYIFSNGDLPDSDSVHRDCENDKCVNPQHLYTRFRFGTTEERFWSKVIKGSESECWEWNAPLNKGYGYLQTEKGSTNNMLAHRYSYELHYGEFDQELYVCHACDNKKCVNPNHLFLGTQLDNIQDYVNKFGSLNRGEDNASAKLTFYEVKLIRKRFVEFKKEIAKEFNLNEEYVGKILNKKVWNEKV